MMRTQRSPHRSRPLLALALVGIAALGPACGEEGADARREIDEAIAAVREYSYVQKDRFAARFQDSVDRLQGEIAHLEAVARTESEEARRKLEPEIAELKRKAADVRQRMQAAVEAGADAWNNHRDASCRELEELDRSVDRCRKQNGR